MAGVVASLALGTGTVTAAAGVQAPDKPGTVSASARASKSTEARRLAGQVAFTRTQVSAVKAQVTKLAKQRSQLERSVAKAHSSLATIEGGLKVTRSEVPRARKQVSKGKASIKKLAGKLRVAESAYDRADSAAAKAERKATKRAKAAKSAGSAEARAKKKATKTRSGKAGTKAMTTWQMAAVADSFAAARGARALELSSDADNRLERATAKLDLVAARVANAHADVSSGKQSIKEAKAATASLEDRRAALRHNLKVWNKSLKRVVTAQKSATKSLKVLKARLVTLKKAKKAAQA